MILQDLTLFLFHFNFFILHFRLVRVRTSDVVFPGLVKLDDGFALLNPSYLTAPPQVFYCLVRQDKTQKERK